MGYVKVEIVGKIWNEHEVVSSSIGDLLKFTITVGYKTGQNLGTSYYNCTVFPDKFQSVKTVLDGKPYPKEVKLMGKMSLVKSKDEKYYARVDVDKVFNYQPTEGETSGKPAISVEEEKRRKEGYKMNLGTGRKDSQEPADGYLMTNIGAGRLTGDKAQENPPVPSDIDDNELPF